MTRAGHLRAAAAAGALALALIASTLTATAQAVVLSGGASGALGVVPVSGLGSSLPGALSSACATLPSLYVTALPLPHGSLCYHGGPVLHSNDTYALYWDPGYAYPSESKRVIDQFLQDVGTASGALGSVYAVTSQYTSAPQGSDPGGRAGNASNFRGAYSDAAYPSVGTPYPTSGAGSCPLSASINACLTDTAIQSEVAGQIAARGLPHGGNQIFTVFTPPNVEVCSDSGATLCSANGSSINQFCSYHSDFAMGDGTKVVYLVQPWTAPTPEDPYVETVCDEPKMPKIPTPVDPLTLSNLLGNRLLSPLSAAHVSAIVNPYLNGWYAPADPPYTTAGLEMPDNGCFGAGPTFDTQGIGGGSYVLQREFNNGGALVTDPIVFQCAPNVVLAAAFVVPDAVNPGDQIQLDGSTSPSTLVAASYAWDFGDGRIGNTPGVVVAYSRAGTYAVKLTVRDRGGNLSSVTHTITVLGPGGTLPNGPGSAPGATPASTAFHATLRLLPVSMRNLARGGLRLEITSNETADGLAVISISRATARRAHIRVGRGPVVVIGRGTVAGVRSGTMSVALRLSPAVARKLKRLGHVTLSLRLILVDAGGHKQIIDVAGSY